MASSSSFSISLLVAVLFCLCHLCIVDRVSANWGLLGTFDPGKGSVPDRPTAYGLWTGKVQSAQLIFTTFDWQENNWLWNSLVTVWNQGTIPVISWEPWFQQAQGTPSNIEILVANGQYDTYITGWAKSLVNFLEGPDGKINTGDDRRVYIRLAHEMNGNWYPWSAKSGESSPSDYVRMFQKVVNLVTNAGADRKHVQWIFSGICFDVGDFKIEQYYPGNSYVDWVGLGGMNWGTSEGWAKWNMPKDLFATMIPRLRTLTGNTKPFAVTEYCSVSNGGGVGGKNNWITTMFDFAIANQARMMLYFNMDKNEGDNGGLKDWAIFGGVSGDESYWYNGQSYKGYSSYRNAAKNGYWQPGSNSNSQRIDDKYYYGTGTCSSNTDCLSGYWCSKGDCVNGDAPAPPASDPVSKPPATTAKVVYSDTVAPEAYSWGSAGLTFKYNQVDTTAPEGRKSIQVTSTSWGGFGIFYETNFLNVKAYTKLQFNMKSNKVVKVELQDSKGGKAPYYAASSGGAWKTYEIPLTTFSNAGVNLGSINGAFVSTMQVTGQYSVDSVQFV